MQEAATLQKVNHPNVLRFYGVVLDSDAAQSVVGIITEYLPDGSLSAYLRYALTHHCNGSHTLQSALCRMTPRHVWDVLVPHC